jgi:hypothetical protein
MNVPIFWDIAPCIPHVNRRFGRMDHLHIQGARILDSKDEGYSPSETSSHMRTTRCCIQEDGNIHNYFCENLRSYMVWTYDRKLDHNQLIN